MTNYGGEETLKEHLFLKLQFFTVLFIITLQPTFPRYCHFTKENFDRLVALWIAEQSYGNILLFEVFHISRRDIRLLFGCAKVNNPEQVFFKMRKRREISHSMLLVTTQSFVIVEQACHVLSFFKKKRNKVIGKTFHVYSC